MSEHNKADAPVSDEQINTAAAILILAAKQHGSEGLIYGARAISKETGEEEAWNIKAEKQGGHDLWLIWSMEHRGWWAPDHKGYVMSRVDAGRYSYDDALAIVRGANRHKDPMGIPNEAMIKDEHEL